MAGRFSIEAVFRAVDRITSPVRRMQTSVGRFATSAERRLRGVQRVTDGVARGLRTVGLAAVAAAAIALPAFADIVRTGAEFEHSLVSAGAKFPVMATKGTRAFEQLKAAARDVGRTTEFTATQAAKGLEFLAMAGFNAEQSIAALPGLVDLATVSQLDLARATDIASDTLGAFGLMTDDAAKLTENLTRVNDVLARTVTSSNTDMEMLFETIKDAGPVATSAGASIENFAAIAGIMANSGIKASRAGTALKNMFVRLQAPPTEARKALDGLGISTADAEGKFIGMNAVLDKLLKKLPEVGKVQRAQALSAIFGLRAIAGSNVVLAQGIDFLEKFQGNLESSTITAERMAKVMRGDTEGSLKSLGSAIESVKLSIFDLSSGPLKQLIDNLTVWVRENEKLLAQRIGDFIVGVVTHLPEIVMWLKRIAISIGVFVAFTTALKTATLALLALNLAMAANPIGLMVIGVALLIAGFSALVVWADDVIASFEKMPGPLRALIGPLEAAVRAIRFIRDNFGAIASAPGRALDAIFGGDDDTKGANTGTPQVSSPQGRLAESFVQALQVDRTEVTIKDETGRAEVTKGRTGNGLTLDQSGAFN